VPVTAAISAGIGAAGSIGSAMIGSNASKNAANAQIQAQQQALAQQQAMFQTGVNAVNPFVTAGQSAAGTLSNLLTPGNSAAALSQMPGFQFQSQYGTMAATNALAARGQGASAGPLATAVSQFNNGLAGTQYFNTVNALQGLTNTGANAASSILGGAINSGNAQANTLGNIGNAQAAGTLGSANAISGGLTGASSAATNALLFNALGGGGGASGLYSSPSYGGGNIFTDAYGGSASNPLAGLSAADYG
jgi:hypothetical protein